jgi:hypothetical protein
MTMKSPPLLQAIADDEAQAEQTRREGQAIVRDHLSSHLQNNTGRSSDYVSWIATLHPENADITIDQRFLIPGNPWWAIYESWKGNESPPYATAVPMEEPPEEQDEETPSPLFSRVNRKNEKPNHPQPQPPLPHWSLLCSPFDLLTGFLITSLAILACLICEILAFFIYLVAVCFWVIAQLFDPPNVFTGLFYSLFMIIYYSFALVDSIVLLTSVFVTEVLAGTEWIVSLLFGGIWRANRWHQFIRRTCHAIRRAFSKPFHGEPRRHSVMCCGLLKGQEGDEYESFPSELVAPYGAPGNGSFFSNSNHATADAERIYQVVAPQDIVVVEGSYKDTK